jgi:protein required for attachment to host cells
MTQLWILVANGSLARFFSRPSAGEPLVPLETVDFPAGRLKGRDLERDRQGHESSDNSSAAAHFEPHTELRKKRMHQFAHQLARRLDAGLAAGDYHALWLVASSPFLGELKAALSRTVSDRVQWVHEADYTSLGVGALEDRLHEHHRQSA